MIRAYHFVADRLRDGRPVFPDGEWLEHAGDVKMCKSGLHASRHPFDAMRHAPGPILCEVDCDDIVEEENDKLVCRRRRIVRRIDATALLREFARLCALDVIHLWDAPDVVRAYLETADETLREAAYDAANDAAHRGASATAWAAAIAAERAASVAVWVESAAASARSAAVNAANATAHRAARAPAWVESAAERAAIAACAARSAAVNAVNAAAIAAERAASAAVWVESAGASAAAHRAANVAQRDRFAQMVDDALTRGK